MKRYLAFTAALAVGAIALFSMRIGAQDGFGIELSLRDGYRVRSADI